MKIYWSAFLSLSFLLVLAGCGAEQFGTTPQSNGSQQDQLQTFQQTSCAGKTLIKPEVDILYVVDNSTSTYFVSQDIKNAIQNTINSISTQFDYRVIGTPLLATAGGNQDYQVLSESALPSSVPASKKVSSASQFTFFQNLVTDQQEAGLERVRSFIADHSSAIGSPKLLRKGAYLFIVLVSNGRDTDVEIQQLNVSGTTQTPEFANRKAALLNLKASLESQQFRMFSVTANTKCSPVRDGYTSSEKSYAAMSQALFQANGFAWEQDADHFDLCSSNGIGTVFSRVNAEIQQIIIPHSYKYAVASNTNADIDTQAGRIQVLKVNNGVTTPMTSGWSYYENTGGSVETRVNKDTGATIPGEPTTARHLVKFDSPYITYPDCVSVTALSNLEYFGFVVLPKAPKLDTVILKINGAQVPASSSNGWSYIGQQTRNIKVQHNGYSDQPVATRSGYMLQLNGSNNYYKSGDNVQINYVPASN